MFIDAFVILGMNKRFIETANFTGIDMFLYFQCGNGEIISVIGKCDGRTNCLNGQDEDNCDMSGLLGLSYVKNEREITLHD